MRPCHPASTVLALALALASPAFAAPQNIPDPGRCTLGTFIDVEGRTNGLPDACGDGHCGAFAVTVRDFANRPVAGSSVVIDFSACPDIQLSCDQLNSKTGQAYLGGKKVVISTDALGQATFQVQGAANAATAGAPGTKANVACGQVYADGVPIGLLKVAAYDVNGAGSAGLTAVDSADLAIVANESGRVQLGFPAYARDDYDHSGAVNGADVARSAAMILDQQAGTGSSVTGTYCP